MIGLLEIRPLEITTGLVLSQGIPSSQSGICQVAVQVFLPLFHVCLVDFPSDAFPIFGRERVVSGQQLDQMVGVGVEGRMARSRQKRRREQV